jgi:gamma-D-glutamyl-L-lysine dipeptidyl-peptidase
MTVLLAVTALAPVLRDPSLRSEQVTQLVLGETATVVEHTGDWYGLRTVLDDYPGWVHAGYVREVTDAEAAGWQAASRWSDGALLEVAGIPFAVPLRARLVPAGDGVLLPDGRRARLATGTPGGAGTTPGIEASRPDAWARTHFAGAPYLWGGVTPRGVDCSGLVQTTFLAHGVILPRDARDQASRGEPVPPSARRPGDLLFFADQEGHIDHVAFAGPDDMLIHSTVRRGGVVVEAPVPGSDAARLLERLTVVRRIAIPGQA